MSKRGRRAENRRDNKDNSRGNKVIKVWLLTVCVALIITLIALGVYLVDRLNDFKYVDETPTSLENVTPEPTEVLPTNMPTVDPATLVTPEPTEPPPMTNEDYGVINIAVFGMDNRYKHSLSGGRSDVNIVLTLDTKNNEVRIASIMRDTLIYLPKKEEHNRINSAIVYEDGPEGAVNAIESEFGIDIDHFCITSFKGMAKILDAMGGVTVDVSKMEMWAMNGLIQEMNKQYGYSTNKGIMNRSGRQKLRGLQAVAYMRIRKDDGVFKRVARQQEVLAAAKDKLSDISLDELDDMMKTVPKYLKTDMEPLELIEMAKKLYDLRGATFKTTRLPFDGHYESKRYNRMAILEYEKDFTKKAFHDYVYLGEQPDLS